MGRYSIPNVVVDVETFPNYFQVGFLNVENAKLVQLEMYEGHPLDYVKLQRILTHYGTMSFNGLNYDLQMLWLAIKVAAKLRPERCLQILKEANDRIILGNVKPWTFRDIYKLNPPRIDHVDIMEVAPGRASLKLYGGRVHSRKMQDLPIGPDEPIEPDQREKVLTYNHNDLLTTADLRASLLEQLDLRCRLSEDYGQDLRSKSDAQIAEAVIKTSIESITGNRLFKPDLQVGKTFKYRTPDYIDFDTQVMKDTLELIESTDFVVTENGKVDLPKSIKDNHIRIGDSVYRMGIGGLHSSEEKVYHVADSEHFIVDRDVASYYPRIILNQKLTPVHMGGEFPKVYRSIVDRRLEAKRKGDKVTSESLKITINGSFGKFGSRWSTLYSPELLIQVTLSGQLSLLLLIERLELAGISVISANTDGVVIKCRHHMADELNAIIDQWELETGFDTEETQYSAIYSRDVNNYIAIKTNGEVKRKGTYGKPTLQKNPTNSICAEAVVAWLTKQVPIVDTIEASNDIREFVTVRQVNGGAVKRHGAIPIPEHETKEELIEAAGMVLKPHRLVRWGYPEDPDDLHTPGEAYKIALKHFTRFEHEDYLGKAIRWVYGFGAEGPLQYKTDNRIVPRSYGAVPMMDFQDHEAPEWLDFQWYISEAHGMLLDLGLSEDEVFRDPLI